MAHDEQPEPAARQFRAARHLVGVHSPPYGVAAYDQAICSFQEGAYAEAVSAFERLNGRKTGVTGIDHRHASLWARHAAACAGYHEQRARLGIVEPERRDPRCGAAGLAVCLRALGRPYDLKTVLAACRVTGIGSSMRDLQDACDKLGLSARAVTADDAGLSVLPKPLVAHVEHDHFIAVLATDATYATYLCSNCGGWPGGQKLTWKQCRAPEPSAYLAVNPIGSTTDEAQRLLGSERDGGRKGVILA